MSNYKLITPEGTKDYLFHEVLKRSEITKKLEELFLDNNYSQAETPTIEYLDVFENRGIPIENMYKLYDDDGRIMVMRPDSTMPIARLCETRLKDEKRPIRLYYVQPVFVAGKKMSGKRNEILQAGIELVGSALKSADLEALTLSVEALQRLCESGFRLEIGNIALFNSLLNSLSIEPREKELIKRLIEEKNYPALNDILDSIDFSQDAQDAKDALKHLPRLFGGEEVFENAKKIFKDENSLKVLAELKAIYNELKSLKNNGDIVVDLGIVNRNDYYTGIVFKGYIEGCFNEAVLTGGRYDSLIKDTGAIGFAVNIDTVTKAVQSQPNLNRPLKIALTKGRLEKDTIGLFQKLSFDCDALINKGRKLILPIGNENIEVVLAKASDVITYIENGVCDIGVVGKDTIMENGGSFFEVTDLGFGKCKFALATKVDNDFYSGYSEKTIATKYPNVTRQFFKGKGMDVSIVKIDGSVELAPLLSLADAIVDIVETGTTLKENGLVVIEDVAPVSARLIVNTVSMKLYKERIDTILERIESAL